MTRRAGRHPPARATPASGSPWRRAADARDLVRRIEADGRFTLEAKPETDVLRRAGGDRELALRAGPHPRRRHGDRRDVRRAQHHVRRGREPRRPRSARCGRSGFGRGAILPLVPHRVAAAGRRRARRPGWRLGAPRHAGRQHVALGGRVQHDDLQRGDGPPQTLARRRAPGPRVRRRHRRSSAASRPRGAPRICASSTRSSAPDGGRRRRAAREARRRCASSAERRPRQRRWRRWMLPLARARRRRRCRRVDGSPPAAVPTVETAPVVVTPAGRAARRPGPFGRRLRRQRRPLHLDRRPGARAASTATSSRKATA